LNPLVTVVCLCYQHRPYVRLAVESVIQQSYKEIQIIIVDDASVDGSAEEIMNLKVDYPSVELLLLGENRGNCKAFNEAYKQVRGEYVIDFATDDVMLPFRIENQVRFFQAQNLSVGVIFTDATYIDEQGNFLRNHFEYLLRKRLISEIPQGNIYRDVLSTYFIPGPTMMVRREVFEALHGYDEELTYEDFDFWVRSARTFHYAFLNEQLTCIRKSKKSMSSGWYIPGDKQLHSTYLVCRKAQELNRSEQDREALIRRVRYEFRQSVLTENYTESSEFYGLLKELGGLRTLERIFSLAGRYKIRLSFIRSLYHKLRYS